MGYWRMVYIPSKRELGRIRAKRIIKKLPRLLKKVDIWCRNSKVCREATKCYMLKCKHKRNGDDIVVGCAVCQLFQLSNRSSKWGSAKLLYEFGDVEKRKGI